MKNYLRVAVFSFLTLMILGLTGVAAPPVLAGETVLPVADSEVQAKMAAVQVPFVQNQGQVGDEQVKYYAKTFAGTVFVTDEGIVYDLPKGEEGGWVLKEEFAGGKAPTPAPSSAPGAPVNYYLGNVEKHVSSYNEISLGEVYDQIKVNLKAYGNNMEKIFTVAPGGDPAKIALKVAGADSISVNEQGELELVTGLGTVKMTCPVAYQIIDGQRVDVSVAYIVKGDTYGFTVGEYDCACPLVIDPLLASTYLGGASEDGISGTSMILDEGGNVYVTGYSNSTTFFTVIGGYSSTLNSSGLNDVFVAKLDGDLSRLLAATYLGGSGGDSAAAIVLDGSGHIYITGVTGSQDFPLTLQRSSTDNDLFVAKLDCAHLNLAAATCFGGSDNDVANAIGLDPISPDPNNKSIFVAGTTFSNDLSTSGYQKALAGSGDGLVVKFSGDLSQVLASTHLGGASASESIAAMTIAQNGEVYVAGQNALSDYPTTVGSLKDSYAGTSAMSFISELSNDLSGLTASTFLGGDDNITNVWAITIDASGDILVAGDTSDDTFPVTADAFDSTRSSSDAFVAKINSNLSGDANHLPLAATFFGGTKAENVFGLATDADDNIYVTGRTKSSSASYPLTAGAYQNKINGTDSTTRYDAFITVFNSSLTSLVASTYLGGSNHDYPKSIVLNKAGNVYVGGTTLSSDFPPAVAPSQSQVVQETYGGGASDIFIAKLSGDLAQSTEDDGKAPIWSAGQMEASVVTETGITLSWEGAMDNLWVTGYQLDTFQDTGMTSLLSSTTVSGAVYSAAVTNLNAATPYTFRVQARDSAGNWSTDGPSKTVSTAQATADLTAPVWPADKALTATNIAGTSLTLTWTSATDNVGVRDYKVFQNTVEIATVSNSVYYEVSNLIPGTLYSFQVQALDAASNISSDGPVVEVTTLAALDTIAPSWKPNSQSATINAVSPTQTYLEWEEATDNVGVTGYNIYLALMGTSDYSVIATVNGTTNCIITLPDTPGITYLLSIKAFDAAGNLSAYISEQIQLVPGESYGVYLIDAYLTDISGEPRVSSNGASIENSTAVPLNPMIKLYFKNNIVADGVWDNGTYANKSCVTMQTAAGANVPVNVLRIPDDANTFNERNNMFVTPVDTLTPGTQYKIIINADLMPKNQKRSLTFERVVNFTTEASASGSTAWPSGGTMTASNPTPAGVTLTWTPADAGAGVTSYVVIKNNSDIITGVDGTATSCEVTGLAPGTNYTFQVQAFNSTTNWSSDGPSTTVTTTADTAVPTWPSASLTESNVAGHGLTLTWSAASDDGAVTGYQIYRDGTSIASVSGTTLTYNVTGLTAETSYTFKVEAGDAAGHWSSDGPSRTVATTAYTGGEVVTGAYAVTPAADAAYTSGETGDGIDTMTVNAGYSGSRTFTVNVSPVTAHDGNEKAVFVQIRDGAQLNLNASAADFDAVNTASTSFEVQPGDVIKVFIVDDLYTNTNIISTVLEQ